MQHQNKGYHHHLIISVIHDFGDFPILYVLHGNKELTLICVVKLKVIRVSRLEFSSFWRISFSTPIRPTSGFWNWNLLFSFYYLCIYYSDLKHISSLSSNKLNICHQKDTWSIWRKLANVAASPSLSFHFPTASITPCILIFRTRSIGALRATTSSWKSFGPLNFVLHTPLGAQAVWPTQRWLDSVLAFG